MTIPEILQELEPYTGRKDRMLPLFALFLLAQFRERRAYVPIVKIVSAPGETPFDVLGDTITEGLSQILASVYDGNPAPLHGLVENEAANEFVRSAALDTFLVLENTGQMPRAEVVEYFRSLFRGKLQRTHSHAWDGLIWSVADLPAPELLEEVRWAYGEGLIDETVAHLEGVERDMAAPQPRRRERQHLIEDAIAETEWWSSFHLEDSQPQKPPKVETPAPPPSPPAANCVAPQPFAREPKIGRNDPCPCGSGKKYKKCCGK